MLQLLQSLSAALESCCSDHHHLYRYMPQSYRRWADLSPQSGNGIHKLIITNADQVQPQYLPWATHAINANLPAADIAALQDMARRIDTILDPLQVVVPPMEAFLARESPRSCSLQQFSLVLCWRCTIMAAEPHSTAPPHLAKLRTVCNS
jgi:hypothetical protein